jgi:hypothetical protein
VTDFPQILGLIFDGKIVLTCPLLKTFRASGTYFYGIIAMLGFTMAVATVMG